MLSPHMEKETVLSGNFHGKICISYVEGHI